MRRNLNQYLILADDFTGANDTGVQLRKRGIPVLVQVNTGSFSECAIVLDTESRNLPAEQAAQTVRERTAGILAREKISLLYKKVDSTLRGNIRSELGVLYELYRPDRILFAPAYPAIGRITLNGRHLLNETPLLQTELAQDPLKPLRSDRLIDYLQGIVHATNRSGQAPVMFVQEHFLAELRAGQIDLKTAVIHSFDVRDSGDLQRIAELGLNSREKILWVGSAGLAEALFERLHPAKPVLSIVGSVSQVSLDQMSLATRADLSNRSQAKSVLTLNRHVLVKIKTEDFICQTNIETYREEILNLLCSGFDCLVSANTSRDDLLAAQELAKRLEIDSATLSERLQQYLGTLTRAVVERFRPAGLFLTGGDTAISVLTHLEATGNRIIRELEPGVVLAQLSDGPFGGLICVTKAGAFGTEQTLLRAAEQIKGVVE